MPLLIPRLMSPYRSIRTLHNIQFFCAASSSKYLDYCYKLPTVRPAADGRRFLSYDWSQRTSSVKPSQQIHNENGITSSPGESTSRPISYQADFLEQEWSRLIDNLRAGGYFDHCSGGKERNNEFSGIVNLPEDFLQAANACLKFCCDWPALFRSFSKNDVETVVENGSAFLFPDALDSKIRLRSLLAGSVNNILELETGTVDVMRFLLSYIYCSVVAADKNNLNNKVVEASACRLLNQLVVSSTVGQLGATESKQRQFSVESSQSPRPLKQNIEMKKGDWVCPRCNFMNFARNMTCLECREDRPDNMQTCSEFKCPQCHFISHGRNPVCSRCGYRRPGLGFLQMQGTRPSANGGRSTQTEIEERLAANDQKAERWFDKVSQFNSVSDMSTAAVDEDFPEIMPMRRGVNKFVVSTRKTTPERKLTDAQYRTTLGNSDSAEGMCNMRETGLSGLSPLSSTHGLDHILVSTSAEFDHSTCGENNMTLADESTTKAGHFTSLQNRNLINGGNVSGLSPSDKLPSCMFAMSQKFQNKPGPQCIGAYSDNSLISRKLQSEVKHEEKMDGGKLEGCPIKAQELHNGISIANTTSSKDLNIGENRFLVCNKENKLSASQCTNRVVVDQANGSVVMPFVPLPSDYFAKGKQPEDGVTTSTFSMLSSPQSYTQGNASLPGVIANKIGLGIVDGGSAHTFHGQENIERWNTGDFTKTSDRAGFGSAYWASTDRVSAYTSDPVSTGKHPASGSWKRRFLEGSSEGSGLQVVSQQSNDKRGNLEYSATSIGKAMVGSPVGESIGPAAGPDGFKEDADVSRPSVSSSWNKEFTGKSLEGSAVKELDPLDMSEEAKAERWFRRVAQIKDISELSQIPDEDFPSIMPMRKGVNRFVVSKRKTPLERKLTSQQYRKNLQIVDCDPSPASRVNKNAR